MARSKTKQLDMSQDWDSLLKSTESRQSFCKWFWKGDNGNILIDDLNETKDGRDFISRKNESARSYIYGVLLKHWKIRDAGKTIMGDWRFVKIGLTQMNTDEGTGNRMENIKKQIEAAYNGSDGEIAAVLFCLPIYACDVRIHTDVEKEVRGSFGIPVDKMSAKKLKFPVPTEWVMTTQSYIDEFNVIKQRAANGKKADTRVIMDNKFKQTKEKLPIGFVLQMEKISLEDGTNLFKDGSYKK